LEEVMSKKQILLLWEYNYWANRRLIARADGLSTAQLSDKVGYMWDSILGTMAHVLGAEWVWRQRMQEGVSPAALLARDQFTTLEALVLRWDEEEAAMRGYLAGLSDADLDRAIDYQNIEGKAFSRPLWQLLTHGVNHGTQHRSEVALYLTNFDRSPGDMDITVFLSQQEAA
jgi:uncharacterized damage-inducible protein DinB